MTVESPINILLVEDNPGDARLIRESLAESGAQAFQLQSVDRLAEGLKRLQAGGIDVLLLDLALPGGHGRDTFVAAYSVAPNIPIIVLTRLEDEALAIAVMHEGAQDYLVKGQMDGKLLWRAIRHAIERKRGEDRIQWLTKAVEQSPASVLITDTTGRIEYVNERFTLITGYTAAEVIGQTPRILKSGNTPAAEYHRLWTTIRNGGEWRGELQNRRKNGELYWDAALISPIRNAAGVMTHFLAVQQDITERKQAEEEIRRLNATLEHRVAERTSELAAANQDLEAFTYSVSHDLRAPLRQVNGFVRILVEELEAQVEGAARHYLQRIREGAEHMGRLVDDLLNLARVGRQPLQPRKTPLRGIVDRVVANLESELADRRVEWRVTDLPTVDCDPGLLDVVFTNLLANAAKYTRARAPAVIEVGQTTHDGEPVLFVRDNGVGFDMKYADKLFGAFQRLHRADEFEGTGVGLATVQRIIHKHGGRIWAEAELNRGATFYFTLGGAS
ncbi:MAG TPA: PAS domain S-box protein [Gemmatimonadales bacterium]|nr:PAS domain S-box protein [Gemmatimonadales bacterium]